MKLPVTPPVTPTLAVPSHELPRDNFVYEPRWDGTRCLAFRDGEEVLLQDADGHELPGLYPGVAAALRSLPVAKAVLDGAVIAGDQPTYAVFDLLAVGDEDLRPLPFERRRARLEAVLADASPPLLLTPVTVDVELARRWLERPSGGGVNGVIAKHPNMAYRPRQRTMVRVTRERTAVCVVGGFLWQEGERSVGSLLLGLFDDEGGLRPVGATAPLPQQRRRRMVDELCHYVTSAAAHPWGGQGGGQGGQGDRLAGSGQLDAEQAGPGRAGSDEHAGAGGDDRPWRGAWVPLRPVLVCEVAYDRFEGRRFHSPPTFLRWRPDVRAEQAVVGALSGSRSINLSELASS